jgi:bacterial/archaeal transporter family protein
MKNNTFLLAVLTMFSWGVGSFISKIAANKIGDRAVFWDVLGYAPAIVIYSLFFLNLKTAWSDNKLGIFLALLSGAIGSLGVIGLYTLLSRKEASTVVPLTAIYPALTAILAFIFLKEQLTLQKGLGIVLSAVALYLLSI